MNCTKCKMTMLPESRQQLPDTKRVMLVKDRIQESYIEIVQSEEVVDYKCDFCGAVKRVNEKRYDDIKIKRSK